MRGKIILISAAVLGAVVAYACAIYDKGLLITVDGGGPDAAEAGADAPPACIGRAPPPRPAADDPSSTPSLTVYNALTVLDFGVNDDAGVLPVIGFDLDSVCTCVPDGKNVPAPDSCRALMGQPPHCDQVEGVDNEGQKLLRQFNSAQFFDQVFINQQIAKGYYGAILRVDDYNGQANDTHVRLSVFSSNGTENNAVPKFDGNDKWTIDSNDVLGGVIGDAGPIARDAVDENAYVRDYQLVGALNFQLSIGAGQTSKDDTIPIELSGGIVVAKIVPVMGSFRIDDGVVSGRWPARKLLTGMQAIVDPFDNTKFLCGQNPTYQVLKPKICSFVDVTQNLLDDNKSAPCDSISIGFRFKSSPAQYGAAFPRPDAGLPCGSQWQDSCQ